MATAIKPAGVKSTPGTGHHALAIRRPTERDARPAARRFALEGVISYSSCDEVDLDPGFRYGRFEPASGHRVERRTIREPSATAQLARDQFLAAPSWSQYPRTPSVLRR